MGLRQDDAKGTAVDDQAEGQYWVINGHHFNSGCCFDYGNAEIDSRDDDNGTMETAYFGDATPWYHGNPPGPWVMTDQENNLVGCVNPDGSKLCVNLPNITWRFVTAMAKGEPHHWTSMGGDAQQGALSVMFDGPRVNATYDPMRKQGAILLGNGGDNSNGSQGTFYEGAMTAAGTFPTDATDQLVQANVVAAKYAEPRLSLPRHPQPLLRRDSRPSRPAPRRTPPSPSPTPPPRPRQASIEHFPAQQAVDRRRFRRHQTSKTFAGPVAPGASVSATFKVTSGPAAYNGDLVASAPWTNPHWRQALRNNRRKSAQRQPRQDQRVPHQRRPSHQLDRLLHRALQRRRPPVDISNWTLTQHPTQQAIFSAIKIPAATKLAPGGFYLLGLANSGLAIPARAGDTSINVRCTTGLSVGDTLTIDTGSSLETSKIATIGTPAAAATTLWQPLPDGPILTIPAGATNVPVTSTSGFAVGEKIALGYGATYPAVANSSNAMK